MNRNNKNAEIISFTILVFTILFIFLSFLKYGKHYLNADISSQLVFGAHLNETGEVVSKSWFYSTEIEFANSGHLYQLMLRFFPSNWHAARSGVILLNCFILSFAFLYMTNVLSCDLPVKIITLASILLPFSSGYMFLMTYGCFYQVFTATVFFDLGTIMRLPRRRYPLLYIISLAIINIIISLSGMRMVVISAVPIGITCTVLFIWRIVSSPDWRTAWNSDEFLLLVGSILNGIFILIGVVINHIFFSTSQYTVADYTSTLLRQFTFSDLLIQLQYILEFLGFVGDIPMVSFTGVSSIVTIILFTFILSCPPILILNKKKYSLTRNEIFLLIFTFVAVYMGILLNVSTPKGRQIGNYGVAYYMAGFIMLIIFSFIFLSKIPSKMIWVRYGFVICLFCIFGYKSVTTIRDNMQSGETQYEEAAEWLVQNDYTEGFASFWNANVLTEASNGQIEVWTLWDINNANIYKWLQKKSHAEVLPQGKCFVYVTSQELWEKQVDVDYLKSIAKESIHLPCDDWVYLFESGEDFNRHFR